jgi:alkylation response protein AidB-like acyl-CoA dehydrogenase
MNFDFSEDVRAMREEVGGFLRDRLPAGAVRNRSATDESFDRNLWLSIAEMGWLGITISEEYGGAGLGYEPLCMLAEEVGAVLPPVPFSSSVYLATEALILYGSEQQKRRWLPGLANGSTIGAFALAERPGDPSACQVSARAVGDRMTGRKLPVFDAAVADFLIVAARSESDEVGLYVVETSAILSRPLKTLDLDGRAAIVDVENGFAQPLAGANHWGAISHLLDRAAVLFAFEQLGGAQAALDMAVAYAKDRYAFGRPIASLQAIKHQLADVYVATELARSNAYFGAWALDHDAAELSIAAATARVAATEAFERAATQNIQTHGGTGFTWESDCHLYYRRAKRLAGQIGGARFWRNRLIDALAPRQAGQ